MKKIFVKILISQCVLILHKAVCNVILLISKRKEGNIMLNNKENMIKNLKSFNSNSILLSVIGIVFAILAGLFSLDKYAMAFFTGYAGWRIVNIYILKNFKRDNRDICDNGVFEQIITFYSSVIVLFFVMYTMRYIFFDLIGSAIMFYAASVIAWLALALRSKKIDAGNAIKAN